MVEGNITDTILFPSWEIWERYGWLKTSRFSAPFIIGSYNLFIIPYRNPEFMYTGFWQEIMKRPVYPGDRKIVI